MALLEGFQRELAVPLEGPFSNWANQERLLRESGLFDRMAKNMVSNQGGGSVDRSVKRVSNVYHVRNNFVIQGSQLGGSSRTQLSGLGRYVGRRMGALG